MIDRPLTKAERQARTAAQPKCTECGACVPWEHTEQGIRLCRAHLAVVQEQARQTRLEEDHALRIAAWRQSLHEARMSGDIYTVIYLLDELIDYIEEQR